MPDGTPARSFDAVGMTQYQPLYEPLTPTGAFTRRRSRVVALAVAGVLVGPHIVTVSRAVANLPVSAVAVAWGRMHHGKCDVHGDLLVSCDSMQGGYAKAGTTVGSVWMYGDADGTDRHRHESRHSDQWAMFGPAFPAWYGAESARTGGDAQRNVFERWAGLHDGGYLP
jgi:hypothetical protein